MATEKTREIREWSTFALSFITFIAIPLGLLILRNQRLEIMTSVDTKLGNYVPMTTYKEDVAASKSAMESAARTSVEIKVQLNTMLIEQVHMSDNFTAFKDRIDNRKP